MTFWPWASGFAAALVLGALTRGAWWDAAFLAVFSVFCFMARKAFPEETKGAPHIRRVR